MKKIIALLLACLMLLAFCACGADKDGETTQTDDSEETLSETNPATEKATEIISEATTTAEENPILSSTQAAYLYNKGFSVASEWFNVYSVYFNYDDCISTEEDIYYAIEHEFIDTIEELRWYLCETFSENLVDSIIPDLFIEENGKLYRICYEVGDLTPTYYLNYTKAELISSGENKCTYKIIPEFHLEGYPDSELSEYTGIESLNYVYERGRWVVDSGFSFTLYPAYVWDETTQ